MERFNNDIIRVFWLVLEIFDDFDDKFYVFNLLFNEILDRYVFLKIIYLWGWLNFYIIDEICDLMVIRDGWKCKFK